MNSRDLFWIFSNLLENRKRKVRYNEKKRLRAHDRNPDSGRGKLVGFQTMILGGKFFVE